MNIYRELDENEFYQETFVKLQYPPMPEEVQGWNDRLQELFCILSVAHLSEGMKVEEADEKAIRQVKKSKWFASWKSV
jgi:hypothetical protein